MSHLSFAGVVANDLSGLRLLVAEKAFAESELDGILESERNWLVDGDRYSKKIYRRGSFGTEYVNGKGGKLRTWSNKEVAEVFLRSLLA